MQKSKKQAVLAVSIFLLLAAGMAALWFVFRPTGIQGEKTIHITVTAHESTTTHTLQTEAEMLGEALQDAGLIEGQTGDFGLFITRVNGIEADSANQEWWRITKGGEEVMTGVSLTPIVDGDTFELVLVEGY